MWSVREPSILERLLHEYRAPTPEKQERGRDLIRTFVQQITDGEMATSRDVIATISQRIRRLDELVSAQLNEILHDERFQKLEAAWRGLAYLVQSARKAKAVKIRVLNAGKREIMADFEDYTESGCTLRRSMVARLGTPGEEPFTLLVGDYEFGRHPKDISLLADLGRLGALAQVPFLAAASAEMFGCNSDWSVAETLNLEKRMATTELIRWADFRGRSYSIYTALVFPHVLLRKPYQRTDPFDTGTFVHVEEVEGYTGSRLLWGSGAWILAARLAAAFEKHSWCAEIHAAPGSGTVGKLPWHRLEDDTAVGPTTTAITDAQALALRRLGFIPMLRDESAHTAAFLDMPTCRRTDWPEDEQEDEEDRLEREKEPWAARLDYVIATCRVAHYVKSIVGQKRLEFRSARACERCLNDWVRPYVGRGTDAPLREASFRVTEVAGRGANCEVEVSVLPNLRSGGLKTPIVFKVPVLLREPLAGDDSGDETASLPWIPQRQESQPSSGRERFLERLTAAEQYLAAGRRDLASAILENLAGEIDRCHLDEWEGPGFALRTWMLLREVYEDDRTLPNAAERSHALLQRICRLDPSKAL
jgi:type VI secretion system protein ImpC